MKVRFWTFSVTFSVIPKLARLKYRYWLLDTQVQGITIMTPHYTCITCVHSCTDGCLPFCARAAKSCHCSVEHEIGGSLCRKESDESLQLGHLVLCVANTLDVVNLSRSFSSSPFLYFGLFGVVLVWFGHGLIWLLLKLWGVGESALDTH